MPKKNLRPAVFLDRDGTINVPPEHRHITRWEEFRFVPGALRAIRRLSKAGWILVVASNQSGVGRKAMTRAALSGITRRMLQEIRRSGGRIDAVYYCLHPPASGCSCRKPRLGMLEKAARALKIDLRKSFVVGDTETDVLMGRAAGCRSILVLTGHQTRKTARRLVVPPDKIVPNLEEAARMILRNRLR